MYIYFHSLVYDIYGIYSYLSGVLQEGVWHMTVLAIDWMKKVGLHSHTVPMVGIP